LSQDPEDTLENVVNIGVRSALLSRCLKKGFSSVVYRISTLADGSGAHRSFQKRFISRKKNIFRDKKKIGVRSALLSRCLKKGFSSVAYRISTLAVGSRAHRSFQKRFINRKKIFLGIKKIVFDRPFCRVALKKGFSSVVYRMFTLAVFSRAHRYAELPAHVFPAHTFPARFFFGP
jgi:DNA-binding transcriptional regulator/RsmH inhibitor MraZ